MTGKEIILKALRFEETPRLPVGVLDGYAWILNQTGKSFQDLFDDEGGAAIAARHYRLLQSDIAYANAHVYNVIYRVMGGEIDFSRVGDAAEIKRPPFTAITDYKKFSVDQVMETAFEEPEYKAVICQSCELVAILGEEKLVSSLSFAPFTIAGMLVGVQEFMACMYEDEDGEIANLIDFAADIVIKISEKFIECGAEAVFIADPVASGDLISPDVYETYALPAVKKVCAAFNQRNIPVFCHICGHTEKRLEPLVGSGLAAFSMDTVDLDTALSTARGHYAIMGNLSPFEVILSKSVDEVRIIGNARAKTAGRSGGFIMMPGCDLPPKAPLANILAMVAAAHNAQ